MNFDDDCTCGNGYNAGRASLMPLNFYSHQIVTGFDKIQIVH